MGNNSYIAIVKRDSRYEDHPLIFNLKATTMEAAQEEFRHEMVQEDFDGGQIQEAIDLEIIESATIFEVSATLNAPLKKWYDEEVARIATQGIEDKEEQDRVEYERLSQKFGGDFVKSKI